MKNIFKVHPFTYLIFLISFFTGHFKDIMIFMTIIIIHEFGHMISGIILKWKIDKIVILPFGGITVFNETLNKPLIEEFIIAIMGPVFQIIFTLILNNNFIKRYSLIILIVNLIPIYPLDGAKILNIILNKFMPFKLSHKIINYFSYFWAIFLLITFLLHHEFIYVLFIVLILLKIKEELSNHSLIYEKFLYERYLYKIKFNKVKVIKNINKFYKDRYHYILVNNELKNEFDILNNKYDCQTTKYKW